MNKVFCLFVPILLMVACATATKKIEPIFYPMPPETPKIQFLTSITDEKDIGKSSALQEFLFGETEAEKGIARPHSIGTEKGKIYVVDRTFKKVLIIDLINRSFDYIRDVKGGALQEPTGIFITKDGYKYVADLKREQIVVFNERNEFYRAYGAENQFRPVDVVVYSNKVYVCDLKDHEIEVLDIDSGEVINKIGGLGKTEGTFHMPTYLTIDDEGNLYVTDSFNFRIQVFDKDGRFLKAIGHQGDYPGAFARPKGVAIDREGHLYAVDAAFENVQIFDANTGETLLPFGKYGPAPGSTYLPGGIHIDYENVEYFTKYVDKDFKVKYLIYVANQLGNKKLNVYGFGDWIGLELKSIEKPKKPESENEAPADK